MSAPEPVFVRPTLSTWVVIGFWLVMWAMIFAPFIVMGVLHR